MKRLYRSLLALLLVGAAGLLTATPAQAHTRLTSSNPAEGASVTIPPGTISLTFAEAVTVSGNPVSVTGPDGTSWTTGPDGTSWTTGPAQVSGDTVSVPVQPTGPAGAYDIRWSVIADDGDAVKGTVHFALSSAIAPTTTAAATTEPAAAPIPAPAAAAPTSSDQTASTGWPWWAWVVVALVVLAVIGLVVGRSRRSVDTS
jgi:methionine-rich copper-binding protein CopC